MTQVRVAVGSGTAWAGTDRAPAIARVPSRTVAARRMVFPFSSEIVGGMTDKADHCPNWSGDLRRVTPAGKE
ncbi:hypothetical protein GCM10023083_66470 [Streptomyces phyllanthi]